MYWSSRRRRGHSRLDGRDSRIGLKTFGLRCAAQTWPKSFSHSIFTVALTRSSGRQIRV